MGVIGLGVRCHDLLPLARPAAAYYEIDPLDERIARALATSYLSNAGDKVDVVIGDGRLSLANETDGAFDVLVVAAFSGDAIPVHLLTRGPSGCTSGSCPSRPRPARHQWLPGPDASSPAWCRRRAWSRPSSGVQPTITVGGYAADWVVVARKRETLGASRWVVPPWPAEARPEVRVWTDDFSDVVQALRWKELGGEAE